jgi:hypothetical protein
MRHRPATSRPQEAHDQHIQEDWTPTREGTDSVEAENRHMQTNRIINGQSQPAKHPSPLRSDSTCGVRPLEGGLSVAVKHVHWAPHGGPRMAALGRGGIPPTKWIPQYNRNLRTTPFTLHVKFRIDLRVITFHAITNRSNLLSWNITSSRNLPRVRTTIFETH